MCEGVQALYVLVDCSSIGSSTLALPRSMIFASKCSAHRMACESALESSSTRASQVKFTVKIAVCESSWLQRTANLAMILTLTRPRGAALKDETFSIRPRCVLFYFYTRLRGSYLTQKHIRESIRLIRRF